MRFSTRFFALVALTFLSASAQALPLYLNTLQSQYSGVKLTFKCQTCHTAAPKLNQFGKDFASNVLNGGGGLSKPESWTLLKMLDSDQDGISNDEEILAGKNPGKADPIPTPTPEPMPEPTPEPTPVEGRSVEPL